MRVVVEILAVDRGVAVGCGVVVIVLVVVVDEFWFVGECCCLQSRSYLIVSGALGFISA